MTSPRLLQRKLAMDRPPRRQHQPAPGPPDAGLGGFGSLDPTAGPSTGKAVNRHTVGLDASLGDRGQENGHPLQAPQQLGVNNIMKNTGTSHGRIETITLHPQIASGSEPFSQFAEPIANMPASQSTKSFKKPATSSAPTPPTQSVAHRGLFPYTGIYGGDAIEVDQQNPTDSGGVVQEESTPTNDPNVPASTTSEWDERKVLSGFPHPSSDLPPEMELRDICIRCPNHLNKHRLDPFIQCDWTEKNIIDEMDEATVLRMQHEIPGCKNFRETLSRRLRARRRKLGPDGIARLRAAEPMHPAHKRGKSRQSGMLDPVKYAARLADGQQKKQGKAAKEPHKACHDGNRGYSKSLAVTDVAAPADAALASTANHEHDRRERAIGFLGNVPAANISSGANILEEMSYPQMSKRIRPAENEDGRPRQRSRLDVSPPENAKYVDQTASHPPLTPRHGSENFSPSYLQATERMNDAVGSDVRKYIMPETTRERPGLNNRVSPFVKRRVWSHALGLWEIEVVDKHGDVVDEYLEKHCVDCTCCPRLWR
ncbi:hypothetical protein PV04_10228 [Phialophora macrospora]|uniref:Uncharacterized protein n=1 Tax=Phialophora macrospora TaxID=1851006 RepID=A0A0D2FTJ3_9EURO|nr:hypothetical protein PV04_10228 [Phialophora macrospora]